MAAFLTTPFNKLEFTKEEFLLIMQENGIKCENCSKAYNIQQSPGNYMRKCLDTTKPVANNHFCSHFNPKSNG